MCKARAEESFPTEELHLAYPVMQPTKCETLSRKPVSSLKDPKKQKAQPVGAGPSA
jgi:hypothetical protein